MIAVKPLSDPDNGEGEGDGEESESLTISVHGADRPGIVKAVAGALADKGGNVVDPLHPADRCARTARLRFHASRRGQSRHLRRSRGGRDSDGRGGSLGVSCTVRRDDADLF